MLNETLNASGFLQKEIPSNYINPAVYYLFLLNEHSTMSSLIAFMPVLVGSNCLQFLVFKEFLITLQRQHSTAFDWSPDFLKSDKTCH